MKLAAGDVAIVTFSLWEDYPPGAEVTVILVAPTHAINGHPAPYLIRSGNHLHGQIWGNDNCLRKKLPPEHPDNFASWDDVPWADKIREPKVTARQIQKLMEDVWNGMPE